ncbi:MAG: hypothetical protein JNM00_09495 [Flavobacteriales bacterium]|nr:hypothetical protein [Flavobacteriales bacterium]
MKTLDYEDAIRNGIVGKSGKRYILESELSVQRWRQFNVYMVKVLTGLDAREMINLVAAAYEDLQHPRIMDAGAKLRKVIEGAAVLSEPSNAAQYAVALMFNAEDETLEERQVFDENAIIRKVEDWSEYGIIGFFQLLTAITPGSKVSS